MEQLQLLLNMYSEENGDPLQMIKSFRRREERCTPSTLEKGRNQSRSHSKGRILQVRALVHGLGAGHNICTE